MLQYYCLPVKETLEQLTCDPANGLTEEQVRSRKLQYGENRLREKRSKPVIVRFFDQFRDVMILILIAAAIVSFVIAAVEGENGEFFEPVMILAIVIINAVMGVIQENKAEKALDALNKLSAQHAKVLRSGVKTVIDAEELVPGDITYLEAGDFVPADARLLESSNLKCDESALTGESVPAEKSADACAAAGEDVPLGDRKNMVFSGCAVTCGTAAAVVTAIGMDTEIGKIADLLEDEAETQTPLQKKLSQLGKYLGIAAAAACTIIFAVGIASGIPTLEIFMTAVSLAVSAIPEGLPAVVTIVLSIGVQRMARKNAIIQRLPAVETLGSASVICSDKTGTLTQNKMTIVQAYCDGAGAPEPISGDNSESVKRLLALGTLCSNGTVVFENGADRHIGDPTETAIVIAAYKNGITKEKLERKCKRVMEIPFDSNRKLMSTVNRIGEKLFVIVKGAFDVMAERCVSGSLELAGKYNDIMAENALRVLAVGYKEIESVPTDLTADTLESGLTFAGLVGMIDPPRPEVATAVETCSKAGIKTVMITGDHIVTAAAVARKLGILREGDVAVTGAELDKITDNELKDRIENISVYARVSPENKIRIVRAWQKKDRIVAMTGDGVNDAPALKAADIGCAMGVTGTDVAKGAADMTLTDDNFVTIVDAVKEGRGIYSNIKKVVGFLLGTNIGEVITVFFAMLLWRKTPLVSMQLLWINLVTDSLPAVALGMEPVEENIMDEKPRPKHESIFAGGFGIRIALQGLMFGILALTAYKTGEKDTGITEGGQTLAFMVLGLSQIVQAYNMRTEQSIFRIGVLSNKKLNLAALISTLLMSSVLFTPISKAFGLIYLPGKLYICGLVLILMPMILMEAVKVFVAMKRRC